MTNYDALYCILIGLQQTTQNLSRDEKDHTEPQYWFILTHETDFPTGGTWVFRNLGSYSHDPRFLPTLLVKTFDFSDFLFDFTSQHLFHTDCIPFGAIAVSISVKNCSNFDQCLE